MIPSRSASSGGITAVGREVDDPIADLQAQRLLDDDLPALDGDEFQGIGLGVRVDRLDLADLDDERAHGGLLSSFGHLKADRSRPETALGFGQQTTRRNGGPSVDAERTVMLHRPVPGGAVAQR